MTRGIRRRSALSVKAFAQRFWLGQDPIGKRVKWGRLDGPRPWFTVVGVVGDMKAIADPRDGEVVGMIARPLTQMLAIASNLVDEITFVLQTNNNAVTEAAIRSALARADSRLAAYQIISLDQASADSRTTERFILMLVSLFGILGLILAAVGLYGLLSLQVARREREFGIRSALGATAAQLIQLVSRQPRACSVLVSWLVHSARGASFAWFGVNGRVFPRPTYWRGSSER